MRTNLTDGLCAFCPTSFLSPSPHTLSKDKTQNTTSTKPQGNKAFLFRYQEILLKQKPHSLLGLGFENLWPQAVSVMRASIPHRLIRNPCLDPSM